MAKPLDLKTRRRVKCAVHGHPPIVDYCFGQLTCCRCDAIVGDSFIGSGSESICLASTHPIDCPNCVATFKRLRAADRALLPAHAKARLKLIAEACT